MVYSVSPHTLYAERLEVKGLIVSEKTLLSSSVYLVCVHTSHLTISFSEKEIKIERCDMLLDGKICFLQPFWTLAEQFDVILKVASALDVQLHVLWTLENSHH